MVGGEGEGGGDGDGEVSVGGGCDWRCDWAWDLGEGGGLRRFYGAGLAWPGSGLYYKGRRFGEL